MKEGLPDTGLPIDFLEAYPFPALVLLVRAPSSLSLNVESLGDNDFTDDEDASNPSLPLLSSYEALLHHHRESDATNHYAQDAYNSTVLSQAPSYLWECPSSASHRVAPVSAPLNSAPRLVWSNEQWNRISDGRDLTDVIEGHALGALQEWVESENPADDLTPSTANCFELELGRSGQVLELVKSRRPASPNSQHLMLVVLTAVGPPRVTTGSRSTSDPRVPSASAIYRSYDGMRPPPAYSILIPHRTPSGMSVKPPLTDHRKLSVVPQCHLLLEEMDWSTTSLGPRDDWPAEITSMIHLAFSSFTKDCVFIGPELVMIYNQSYSQMVGHPKCFGKPVVEVWGPLWQVLKPLFDRAMSGVPVHRENDLVLHQRDDRGRFVERYQTYSLIPIVDPSRKVLGVYNPSYDTTHKVLVERRINTTRDLVELIATAGSVRAFYKSVCRVLGRNPADAPFIICYSVKKREDHVGPSTVVDLELQSTVGVPQKHPCIPSELSCTLPALVDEPEDGDMANGFSDLNMNDTHDTKHSTPRVPPPSATSSRSSGSGPRPRREVTVETNPSAWPIARALATRQSILVDGLSQLVQNFELRQWDALPDRAMVIPISSDYVEAGTPPSGVMIIGLNLFRPLDVEYDDWLQVMRVHLASALDSVIAAEEEANRRAEREKLERAKSTWFRGSAHEFQTPLNLIAAPLEDLTETDLSHSQRQALTIAMRNVHRLQGLVSSLLEFSRMEAGHVTMQFMPVDLASYLENLLAIFEPAIQQLGIQSMLCLEFRDEPTAVDPYLLEVVLSHLLVAALKTAKHNKVSMEVKFDDEYVTFEVANACVRSASTRTELSTAPDHWSPPSKTKPEEEDVALGIALARHIVRLHGGELWSENVTLLRGDAVPMGSVMTARLPLNLEVSKDHAPPVSFGIFARQLAKEVVSWANVESPEGGSPGSLNPTTTFAEGLMFERSDILLIVDDNADSREYCKHVFSPFCTVIEAASGAEALAITEKVTPDLVLCDWLMRPMCALELLATLRKRPNTKWVPCVVVSATSDDESRVEAYIAGVDDYMIRPLRSKEVLLRVHLHMQMGKKRAQLEKLFAEQLLEVEKGRREAEESKQHQEFLVDLISHEIRTPVSAILQCSSLVKENLVSLREQLRFSKEVGFRPSASLLEDLEEDVAALDSIYQCGLVQERIAGDVLSLACIQREMLSFHDVEMHYRHEAAKVLSVFGNEARMKRIDLQLTFGDTFQDLGVEYLKTDPVRLGQVITNLISNAIRFTTQSDVRKVTVHSEVAWEPPSPGTCALPEDRSTEQLCTTAATEEKPIYLFVSVTDTGPGIKESEQEVLFHSFHQGNKAIHTRFGGSGLGLFICKNISTLLGGNIEVKSKLGHGTVFRFYIKAIAVPSPSATEPTPPVVTSPLPLQRLPSAPLPSPPHAPEKAQRWSSYDSPIPLRVLIVEDNIINQTVLKRQLVKAQFSCDVANDGEQALVAIHEAHRRSRYGTARGFDAILMDLEMPVMDGLTAVRHIRQAEIEGLLKPQLVIALTGNARQGQREQAMAAGMDDVMIKPYRLAELIANIQKTVSEHRLKHGGEVSPGNAASRKMTPNGVSREQAGQNGE